MLVNLHDQLEYKQNLCEELVKNSVIFNGWPLLFESRNRNNVFFLCFYHRLLTGWRPSPCGPEHLNASRTQQWWKEDLLTASTLCTLSHLSTADWPATGRQTCIWLTLASRWVHPHEPLREERLIISPLWKETDWKGKGLEILSVPWVVTTVPVIPLRAFWKVSFKPVLLAFLPLARLCGHLKEPQLIQCPFQYPAELFKTTQA